MEKLNFRTLNADEIECRVGSSFAPSYDGKTKGSCILLMYKNARVDMALLDETVGPENWEKKYEVINNNLFCTLSIRTSQGDWVHKQDVGVESNTEKEKGEASDAFKRAGFCWGIGRELYTCPVVKVTLEDKEWSERNGKKVPKIFGWYVSVIEYDSKRRVSKLEIKDGYDNVRFSWPTKTTRTKATASKPADRLTTAINATREATSRVALIEIWHSYSDLQENEEFKKVFQEMGNKYPKK